MKQFFDKDFWKNTVGCTVGTLIGILLTFGTSSYLENRNKTEMARKTVMLTLHNLDASTRNMQTLLDELQQYDTLFTRAASLMPDRLGQMGSDSLQMFVNAFGSRRLLMTDHTTSSIFSNSFEVWQCLDDEKVIGRIGNCYSVLDVCRKEYLRMEELRLSSLLARMSAHGLPRCRKGRKGTPRTVRRALCIVHTFQRHPNAETYARYCLPAE